MSLSRRQFMLSTSMTGAGLILPATYERLFNYFEKTGEQLLAKPKRGSTILSAVDLGSGDIQLNVGDPWQEPTPVTLRVYLRDYVEQSLEEYLEEEGPELSADEINLDDEIKSEYILDVWCAYHSPNARAFSLLKELDLGANFEGLDPVGEIHFIDGPCPGNDYLSVHAVGALSLSLLQHRLNELETEIYIKMV